MKVLLFCMISIALACVPVFSEQPVPETSQKPQPLSIEEMNLLRVEYARKAAMLLDSFVGTYTGTVTMNGVEHTAKLVINPKTMNGFYYMGNYALKTGSGEPAYEAFTVFSFNAGAMSYLFFYFGNDGFIRNYMGQFTESDIVLQSPHPKGLEFVRWSLVDENTLKHETWNPKDGIYKHPEGDPDKVTLFKRIQ